MSRRTKLIITALFLVLLAIPTAYVAITWRPHEPLRIRLVREHEQLEVRKGWEYRVLEIEVENTSSVPIHVARVAIHREGGPQSPLKPIGDTEMNSAGSYPTTDERGDPIIPAHGRWRGRALTRHLFSGNLTDGNTFFIVNWTSHTRHRVMDIYWPLAKHLPNRWRRYIPSPAYEESDVPLDPSSP